jgi:branched-chain amino acid transport system ATP-binding protein
MTDQPVLELEAVSVAYGGVLAIEDVSLRVPARGSVCLLGPNGAGKTTILRAISGLLGFHGGRILSGRVRYRGRDVTGATADRLVRLGICQVLERRHVFADLTVADNLRAGAFARHDRRASSERMKLVLEIFPVLGERVRQQAGLLSGGEQQMVAIGRALMGEPELLLLDEPSLGLAPLVISAIGEALQRVRSSTDLSMLLVEQSSAMAGTVSDHSYLLESGHVRADGPTTQLLADDRVRSVYLGASA